MQRFVVNDDRKLLGYTFNLLTTAQNFTPASENLLQTSSFKPAYCTTNLEVALLLGQFLLID